MKIDLTDDETGHLIASVIGRREMLDNMLYKNPSWITDSKDSERHIKDINSQIDTLRSLERRLRDHSRLIEEYGHRDLYP